MQRPSALESKPQHRRGALKGKLLMVDEDLADLQLYSAILQQLGYEVRTFDSYSEAAACLGREVFDLVLVSQGSPYFEGRSVLARAMERDRRTPVLVLTRAVEIACYVEAMHLGARDYTPKPLPSWEIGKLVANHLTSHSGSA